VIRFTSHFAGYRSSKRRERKKKKRKEGDWGGIPPQLYNKYVIYSKLLINVHFRSFTRARSLKKKKRKKKKKKHRCSYEINIIDIQNNLLYVHLYPHTGCWRL